MVSVGVGHSCNTFKWRFPEDFSGSTRQDLRVGNMSLVLYTLPKLNIGNRYQRCISGYYKVYVLNFGVSLRQHPTFHCLNKQNDDSRRTSSSFDPRPDVSRATHG